jgi:hypothetical protein
MGHKTRGPLMTLLIWLVYGVAYGLVGLVVLCVKRSKKRRARLKRLFLVMSLLKDIMCSEIVN